HLLSMVQYVVSLRCKLDRRIKMPVKNSTGSILSRARPSWISAISKTFQGFVDRLPDNWNSYGAKRIQPELAEAATRLRSKIVQPETPKREVVPTTDGGLQIEW